MVGDRFIWVVGWPVNSCGLAWLVIADLALADLKEMSKQRGAAWADRRRHRRLGKAVRRRCQPRSNTYDREACQTDGW